MGAASKIVQAAIEVLAKKSGGALPTDEASRRLSLAPSTSEAEGLGKRQRKGRHVYSINDGAENIGFLDVENIEDGVARISDIVISDPVKRPGPAGMRRLLEQLRQAHPEIKSIAGERVSGARRGGGHGFEGSGQEVSVPLPLPTDASRAGFDPQTYYHYSEAPNIEKFDPQAPDSWGRKTIPFFKGDNRGASYFTSDPDYAGKLMLEKAEAKDFTDSKNIEEYLDTLSGFGPSDLAATTYPVKIKTDKIFDYNDENAVDDLIDSFGKYMGRELGDNAESLLRAGDWSTLEMPALQGALKDAGYRGYKTSEPGTVGLFYSDKGDVRSIFAKFDPAKSESGEILASVPAIATGLAGYGALSNVVEENNGQSSN